MSKTVYKTIITNYLADLQGCFETLDTDQIAEIVEVLVKAFKQKKTIFILGNGGSASNASHMACDLGKGTLKKIYDEDEQRIRVISLTDNVALLTAFANDCSFEDIFIQQLRNLISPGDVVIALSASGNSPNVIKAIEYAKRCKAIAIGILGFKNGGKLKSIVNKAIIVKSNLYGPCEDLQLIINHIITTCIASIINTRKK